MILGIGCGLQYGRLLDGKDRFQATLFYEGLPHSTHEEEVTHLHYIHKRMYNLNISGGINGSSSAEDQ